MLKSEGTWWPTGVNGDDNMKKIVQLSSVLLLMLCYSCTTTKQVTSLNAYKEASFAISSALSEKGFSLSGTSQESKNEVYVSGTSYSRYTGYGTRMSNDYWQYDSFTFTDSFSNNVNYTVKYQMVNSDCIVNLEVVNCNASKDYNNFCGNDGTIKTPINYINNNPDKVITVPDRGKTIMGVTFGTVGLSLIAVVILLLL